MRTILIGIDDTDNESSPGTGSLARRLCADLVNKGMRSLGVTRHQFLFDRAIPYTSHNSGACIAIETGNDIEAFNFIFDFISSVSAPGSDPGVCVALSDEVPKEISAFGYDAQKKILPIEKSFELAKGHKHIKLRGLGGNCLGVIGAIASVGLRAHGNDGRFVDLPGLRELSRRVKIEDFNRIGIEVQYKAGSPQPTPTDVYDTLDWARPSLINGKPVLIVERSEKENVWVPVNRKKDKRLQHST